MKSRISAILQKEFLHILRDPRSLAIVFLLPVMMILLYGYAITFDVTNITTVVYDRDKSLLSRELVKEFEQSGYFTISAYLEDEGEVDAYLNSGEAMVAMLVPPDFGQRV